MNPEMFDGSYLKGEKSQKGNPILRKTDLRSKGRPRTQSKGIKAVSPKQEIRNAYLAGVKAERIVASGMKCERCLLVTQQLDLHHADAKRSQGKGYSRLRGPGVDDPRNLMLLCRRCHRKLENDDPRWSGKETA